MKETIQTRPSEAVPVMNDVVPVFNHVLTKWIVLKHVPDGKSGHVWEIATFNFLSAAIQFTAEETDYWENLLEMPCTFTVIELG